ncbi:aldehyde dehydrogenase family protein [Solimonas sp. K1W22B-7]|nr:aldehyde dehydrogenase family protein [Solimonas sp. K1W22B-7]AXQ31126.1 aldehyde dehydrogenase family protein [Solimonas sp. K1W22B-7]
MQATQDTTRLHATAVSGPRDMQRVFDLQQETAQRWRQSSAAERIARIVRLRDVVLANQEGLHEAAFKDFRKPPAEVDFSEILPVMADISEYRHKLKSWMKPMRVGPTRLTVGVKGWVQYQPRGRCLILSPWNYPVQLSLAPLIACLGGGNTAIVKPSEVAPHMSAWLAKVLREAFKEEEVAVFEGDAGVSTALLELPFDHIFFTGSPAIGKVVMAAASKNLTSVTLELGGKSPTIVDESADLDLAAGNIMWSKLVNSGQTCIAPDHLYVHESVKEAFVQKAIAVIRSRFGDTPQDQMRSPSLTHMVNVRHTQRVAALVEDAKAKGAQVLCGDFVSEKEQFVAPTLLDRVPANAKIMDEEIFGPVLPIIAYRDLGEVVRKINAAPKPLALYMFSRDQANIDQLTQGTTSGGACINHSLIQAAHGHLPFGGVNNSGIGNYHGLWGFRCFSHERAVVQNRFMLARMFYPPYTEAMHRKIKLLIKWFKAW